MLDQPKVTDRNAAPALVKLIILAGLTVWLFQKQVTPVIRVAATSSESTHAILAPVMVLLLVYLRRSPLAQALSKGSGWGILLILAGIFLYAEATWPFSFGYVTQFALIPVLAGAVWVACGGKVLKLALPMLLLLVLAIPIGPRLNASLIIYPETYTISTTAHLLDLLPGVQTTIDGIDLVFNTDHHDGIVALGQSNRGAQLLLVLAALGLFVTFSRIRSPARVLMAILAAGPIILFCNLLRFLSWALIAIYTNVSPTDNLPRNIAAVCSLLAAYLLFALVCAIKFNLFVVENQEPQSPHLPEVIHE